MYNFVWYLGISTYLKIEGRGDVTKTKRGKPLGYYVLQKDNLNSYPVWKNAFSFYLFRFPFSDEKSSARWAVGPSLGQNTYMVLYSWPGANSALDKKLIWNFFDGGWKNPEYFRISVHDKGKISINCSYINGLGKFVYWI